MGEEFESEFVVFNPPNGVGGFNIKPTKLQKKHTI
jgi:hypothetical protein